MSFSSLAPFLSRTLRSALWDMLLIFHLEWSRAVQHHCNINSFLPSLASLSNTMHKTTMHDSHSFYDSTPIRGFLSCQFGANLPHTIYKTASRMVKLLTVFLLFIGFFSVACTAEFQCAPHAEFWSRREHGFILAVSRVVFCNGMGSRTELHSVKNTWVRLGLSTSEVWTTAAHLRGHVDVLLHWG